jgi:hypothetical protein
VLIKTTKYSTWCWTTSVCCRNLLRILASSAVCRVAIQSWRRSTVRLIFFPSLTPKTPLQSPLCSADSPIRPVKWQAISENFYQSWHRYSSVILRPVSQAEETNKWKGKQNKSLCLNPMLISITKTFKHISLLIRHMLHDNTDSPMQPPSTLKSHAKTNRSIRRPLRFQPWPLPAH